MEAESDGQMFAKKHKSVIETNQQFGAGRVEPEKEKNPHLKMKSYLNLNKVNNQRQLINMRWIMRWEKRKQQVLRIDYTLLDINHKIVMIYF